MLTGLLMPVSLPEQSSLSHHPVFIGGLELLERPVGFSRKGGLYGVLFGLVVVGAAALDPVLDFGFTEQGVLRESPNYLEGYGAFGLVVTLVWLYLELHLESLRLLSKLRR